MYFTIWIRTIWGFSFFDFNVCKIENVFSIPLTLTAKNIRNIIITTSELNTGCVRCGKVVTKKSDVIWIWITPLDMFRTFSTTYITTHLNILVFYLQLCIPHAYSHFVTRYLLWLKCSPRKYNIIWRKFSEGPSNLRHANKYEARLICHEVPDDLLLMTCT